MLVRAFILYGAVLVALGTLWPVLRRFGIDGLPGDFVTHLVGWQITVPVSSAALVSVALGALLWLTGRRS